MNPFSHFILTRFNVPLKFDLPTDQRPQHMGLDAGWLARRFDLFERVCLASVNRQTEGAFQWLVFMDWATPVEFKERMAALTVRHEFLRPVYCSQFDDELVIAEIRRREAPGGVRITTRLDNDDAIHPRMIEHVQELTLDRMKKLDLNCGFFISYPLGCMERRGDFYLRRDRFNPFVSFVSAPECSQTVLITGHREIAKAAPVIFKCAHPMWCQVVHEDNAIVPIRGIYWPGGGNSEFAAGVTNGSHRSVFWKCAEVIRSAVRVLLNR